MLLCRAQNKRILNMSHLKNKSKTIYYVYMALKHLWSVNRFTFKMFFAMICGTIEVIGFFIRQKMFNNHLPNFNCVEEGKLYRGGQPTEEGVGSLVEIGVKTLVILRTGFDKDYYEKYTSRVSVIHIPFNPFKPKRTIVMKFLKVMQDQEKGPVYVHCFHGADRTGTLVALYRIVFQGWTKEQATYEMRRKGLHWWHRPLMAYINNLDIDSIKSELGISKESHFALESEESPKEEPVQA